MPTAAISDEVDLSVGSASGSASAQSGSTRSKDPGNLHIFWVPGYLWFSGLNGNVEAKGISVPVSAAFSDIFDNTNIGYMGAADIRYRGAGLLTDVVYIRYTTQEQSSPFGRLLIIPFGHVPKRFLLSLMSTGE